MSSITITNGVINLDDLHYEMNKIVQTYMNDNPIWSIATSNLEYLLSQTASFYLEFVESGKRPQSNQYWYIFASLTSHLCFNYGVALFNHLNEDNIYSKEYERVENSLITAALVKPDSNNQEFVDYLEMIESTYVQSLLRQGTLTKSSLTEYVLSLNNNLEQNLINLHTNIKNNYIPL